MVRRGTANPFSPVQIRVSPDQQKARNLFFSSVDTCLILSIWSEGFLKDCESLLLGFKEIFSSNDRGAVKTS